MDAQMMADGGEEASFDQNDGAKVPKKRGRKPKEVTPNIA
jgi:hypothetical protein